MKRTVQTCTNMRSTMNMKSKGLTMTIDGHGYKQRQGVEITGLRNDVLRGNRINDENNQMLRHMLQHLHLQGPPYGPQ